MLSPETLPPKWGESHCHCRVHPVAPAGYCRKFRWCCCGVQRFVVKAFERAPGKWRASIRRADGKPVKVVGGKKLEKSVTRFDARTAVAAIRIAMAAIDAGTFVRDRVATEKFWRRGQSSRTRRVE